jgi:uncharacterized protein (TIGR00645 family)
MTIRLTCGGDSDPPGDAGLRDLTAPGNATGRYCRPNRRPRGGNRDWTAKILRWPYAPAKPRIAAAPPRRSGAPGRECYDFVRPLDHPTRQRRPAVNQPVKTMEALIFWSRWLQAPLYLGLIVAQGVYVYQFMHELAVLVTKVGELGETEVMLIVLGLIDVVMIANLLIMVIIGGYETFVSKLDLEGNPDQPEWLSHVNAGVLKVKLAVALISISSIHLLRTFINAAQIEDRVVVIQVAIHLSFLISALAVAWTDKIMMQSLVISSHGKH